jgi:uncharacterized membrane protein
MEDRKVVQRPIHPIRAVLLAGTVPLFLGVLLGDIAYSVTYEVQWKNFASWLIVGGLVFAGFALLWELIGLFRRPSRAPRSIVRIATLLAIFVLGFVDALVHAADAWASMPTGLVLSAFVAVLAITAASLGLSRSRAGAVA